MVVTLHGYDVTVSDKVLSQSWTGRLYLKRRRKMWEQATAFLCVSDFLQGQAAMKAGFPQAKLRTHYIGVDRANSLQARLLMPESVLFVGRLVEKKGCDLFIRAMQTVQQSFLMPR